MYLLFGDRGDLVCAGVLASLEARGCAARLIANPTLRPFRFAWRFDAHASASRLTWEDGSHLSEREIEGVLVRRPGRIAAEGWNPDDLAYAGTEANAALLAWLWSLDCPVINRCRAALWYRSDSSLLFWHLCLERYGLRWLPSLISNVEEETRGFGALVGEQPVYAPLTAADRYLLDSDDLWNCVAAMQRLGPVHLTQASTTLHSSCVVGLRVVWEGTAPADADALEPAFVSFAAAAGLSFVEIVTTPTLDGMVVASVNPYPCLEHFGHPARREIVAGLVQLLTGELDSRPSQGSRLFWIEE